MVRESPVPGSAKVIYEDFNKHGMSLLDAAVAQAWFMHRHSRMVVISTFGRLPNQ